MDYLDVVGPEPALVFVVSEVGEGLPAPEEGEGPVLLVVKVEVQAPFGTAEAKGDQ